MKAILLLAFGGPSSVEEVEDFLIRIMKGRKLSLEQIEEVKNRYRLIGGRSPLLNITETQAKSLEKRLQEKGFFLRSYIGMLYGDPRIEESIKRIMKEGIKEVIAIPMATLRSKFTTEAYKNEVNRIIDILNLKISFIDNWNRHPLFIEAIREKILEGLKQFPLEEREDVYIIFTAHSLPRSKINNDTYLNDFEEIIKAVLDTMDTYPWCWAFQSRGFGGKEWLGPDVESVLKELSEKNIKKVLIVPIGFVSDNIEILYDIDIHYRNEAKSLGIILKRSPSLNNSQKFIEALSAVIEEHLIEEKFKGEK